MPITEEKALELLEELIRKPETNAADIPAIWSNIIQTYNKTFAVEEPKKKRRRRTGLSPNLGWPAGVSRAEYMAWKDQQAKSGVTEKVNPQEYKRLRDAGMVAPAPKAEKLPKAKASGAAKPARKPAAKK